VRVYVCDGTARRPATVSQWFEGSWDGRSPLTLVRRGFELRIDRVHGDGRITGRILAFSGPHLFSVGPVERPAGLYDATDARSGLRVTWIVLGDRSIRGAMVSPKPPRCRFVLVSGPNGTSQWVTVC
jgi:hypothetical protein